MTIALVLSASLIVFGQKQAVVSGFVEDEQTGEPIAFATILLPNGGGTITELDGSFSLKLPEGEPSVNVTISCVGYAEQSRLFTLENVFEPLNLALKPGVELATVEIVCSRPLFVIECYTNGGYGCYGNLSQEFVEDRLEANHEDENQVKITTYPNPFISTLTVEMEVKTAQPYLFHLYNEAGQLVFAESRELEAGLQNFQLDLVQRHLPEGAYFLRISDDAGEIRTKRLVKVSP